MLWTASAEDPAVARSVDSLTLPAEAAALTAPARSYPESRINTSSLSLPGRPRMASNWRRTPSRAPLLSHELNLARRCMPARDIRLPSSDASLASSAIGSSSAGTSEKSTLTSSQISACEIFASSLSSSPCRSM